MTNISTNFLRGLDKIISKDMTRPTLTGVYFSNGNAYATDTHCALIIDLSLWNLNDTDKENLDGYFADASILENLKIKKGQRFSIGKGKINIQEHDKYGSGMRISKSIHLLEMKKIGTYPDLEAVFPDEIQKVGIMNFNAELIKNIKNIQDVYKFIHNDDEALYLTELYFTFHGNNSVLKIKNKKGGFTGAILNVLLYRSK